MEKDSDDVIMEREGRCFMNGLMSKLCNFSESEKESTKDIDIKDGKVMMRKEEIKMFKRFRETFEEWQEEQESKEVTVKELVAKYHPIFKYVYEHLVDADDINTYTLEKMEAYKKKYMKENNKTDKKTD